MRLLFFNNSLPDRAKRIVNDKNISCFSFGFIIRNRLYMFKKCPSAGGSGS